MYGMCYLSDKVSAAKACPGPIHSVTIRYMQKAFDLFMIVPASPWCEYMARTDT